MRPTRTTLYELIKSLISQIPRDNEISVEQIHELSERIKEYLFQKMDMPSVPIVHVGKKGISIGNGD